MLKKKVTSAITDNRHALAAFFLPVLIVVSAFAVTGIFPFGPNQIAVIDMYHQYVPFLSELQYKLQHLDSLFYTWNGAGGSNFWNLIAYYGASPLNLLLVLFPAGFIMEGVTSIFLIKIGLAGSFTFLFLRYIRSSSWIAVGFSTMYALCSYVMGYYWCIMWMDAVMLFPLVMLGLYRLIDEGRPALYTVSLAFTVFCNYYIAIMVCIFILFYYPVLYFIRVSDGGRRKCLETTGLAAGCSFLGIVMAAVMLVPAYISMQNTYYITSSTPEDWYFYYYPIEILNQLLPETQLTFREGLPNLYSGMLVVMLLAVYIMCDRIPVREKLLNGAFLVFIFFSLNTNILNFLWHGMHFPNQLPYRYTFMVSFLLITMAYRAFSQIDSISIRRITAILAAGFGYYLIMQNLMADKLDNPTAFFYIGMILLTGYSAILILYRSGRISVRGVTILILLLISAEMCWNTCSSFEKVGNTTRENYMENGTDIMKLAEEAKGGDFARIEIDEANNYNSPAFYHFRGLSQFSSSINADVTALMERIGLEGAPEKNRFNYNVTNPVTNSMLNVKYIIGKNQPLKDKDFRLVGREGNSGLYESDYPLSIGYMAPHTIRTWKFDSINPFDNLNSYVKVITEGEIERVFEELEIGQIQTAERDAEITAENIITVSAVNQEEAGSVSVGFTAVGTQKYYIFCEADHAESITVQRTRKNENSDIQSDCGSIINLGEIKDGEEFQVVIGYLEGRESNVRIHVCTLDEAAWAEVYEKMSADMMTVEEYGDTYIRGNVKAGAGEVLVTSIPYEKGWTLRVDGKKREISELAGDAWISLEPGEGNHDIELSFRPPGIIAGGMITLVCILLLMGICRTGSVRSSKVPEGGLSSERYPSEESDCSKG
ncbi:MAG: YfhO family protein [Lentihominibacter sp.]|jgi:uncharacterized membrane protein YfhO